MVTELLTANVIHGLVALGWAFGVERVAGPWTASARMRLYQLALALPVVVLLLRLLGVPPFPDGLRLVRVDVWAGWLTGGGMEVQVPMTILFGGTAVVFAVQELAPFWQRRRKPREAPRAPDQRLEATLLQVRHLYAEVGVRLPRGNRILARRIETDQPTAALHGLRHPTLLVSRKLLNTLDDDELAAVVAHELAHAATGGSLELLAMWLLRALQAMSPAALVAFRHLVEVREETCDALAARVTGRPAALASALLSVHDLAGSGRESTHLVDRARDEVLRRAEHASTRDRVKALLAWRFEKGHTVLGPWSAMLVLGGLLWTIG
ncbi:MAG: M48 family metalloprotease [Myxococcota bacterium]